MAGIASKSFDSADEVRTPDKARIEVVDLGSAKAMRMTAQPGWRWSESVKPVVKTDSCRARHVGTVTAGSLRVRHDDGTEQDLTPGAAYVIEPGTRRVGDERRTVRRVRVRERHCGDVRQAVVVAYRNTVAPGRRMSSIRLVRSGRSGNWSR